MIIILYVFIGILIGIVGSLLHFNPRIAAATHEKEIMQRDIDELRRQIEHNEQTIARQTTEIEQARHDSVAEAEMRARQFTDQLKLAQEQLKNTTEQLLKARANELNEANNTQLTAILNPLKEKIAEMKTAMDAQRDAHTRNTAAMQQAIENVMQRTATIGDEAGKLARALRHENKTQGNWGEVILAELLESQGLHQGIHYDVQSTLRDRQGRPLINSETDKRMIPDVILHYPEGKDAIIDAKTSLSAYLDYMEATSDDDRDAALKRHIDSLRRHVKELTSKRYQTYILPPRQSLDYVIMFVPNESALQLALTSDASLWRDALREGVFITGELNLTAALRIIHLAWVQEQQAQNQREVFDEATKLIERVGEFYSQFQTIRERIDSLAKAYDSADKKLLSGRQSLMVPARRLRDMGAKQKPSAPLPDPIDTALDSADNDK